MKVVITESQFDNLFLGKKVMVYYNLHKHTFSVTYDSKVIMHADYVKLGNVEFRVRKGGKERVRSEKSKNVHAFVIGKLLDYWISGWDLYFLVKRAEKICSQVSFGFKITFLDTIFV